MKVENNVQNHVAVMPADVSIALSVMRSCCKERIEAFLIERGYSAEIASAFATILSSEAKLQAINALPARGIGRFE